MIGTYVLSSGYYDAYYKLAQKLRTKLIQEFESVFQDFDFLVGPATPTTAFKLGENTKDPLRMYMSDILTVASNLSGTPAISIPSHKPEGLPVGLQFMASYGSDRRLLEMAKAAERIVA
jgi:aspartyl-tRNA(Asn)/glutamyl-tRNA(Gln) amidotransferase subunit A